MLNKWNAIMFMYYVFFLKNYLFLLEMQNYREKEQQRGDFIYSFLPPMATTLKTDGAELITARSQEPVASSGCSTWV